VPSGPMRDIYEFDPLCDDRWDTFLMSAESNASIFHTRSWLTALRRTYRYQPIVLTTQAPGTPLREAMLFCAVRSRLIGSRLVSLPFSDHCSPLPSQAVVASLMSGLASQVAGGKFRYIELRLPGESSAAALGPYTAITYCHHTLDLTPDVDSLFNRLHKSSTQRKIGRAEREGLTLEEGTDESVLNAFHRLMCLTRRRHGLPPQPLGWFRNLVDCLGSALSIRLALQGARPVAGVLTLQFKDTVVYKYGCSDAAFNNLGGIHLLLWHTICVGKRAGLRTFDLGRSHWQDEGLITFKDRWGADRSSITNLRLLPVDQRAGALGRLGSDLAASLGRTVLSCLPVWAVRRIGEVFYRHAG
jgi:hypothetical protein